MFWRELEAPTNTPNSMLTSCLIVRKSDLYDTFIWPVGVLLFSIIALLWRGWGHIIPYTISGTAKKIVYLCHEC